MERLTKRVGNTIDFANGKVNLTDHKSNVKMLFERLAEYEDTGMTPKEIRDKVYRNRWIPVSERLPSEEECNLFKSPHPCYRRFICTVQLDGTNPMIRELYFCKISGWTSGTFNYSKYVIAWRPLPPAWKESVEE